MKKSDPHASFVQSAAGPKHDPGVNGIQVADVPAMLRLVGLITEAAADRVDSLAGSARCVEYRAEAAILDPHPSIMGQNGADIAQACEYEANSGIMCKSARDRALSAGFLRHEPRTIELHRAILGDFDLSAGELRL